MSSGPTPSLPGGSGALLRIAFAGIIGVVLSYGGSVARAAPRLIVEPGLPIEAEWVVPVGVIDATGAPVNFFADDVRLSHDGETVTEFTLVPSAPAEGGAPTATAVLLGGRGLPAAAAGPLAGYLAAAGAGSERALFVIDGDFGRAQPFGAKPLGEQAIDDLEPGAEPSRLWDGVLEALKQLAKRPGALRRTLVVIGAGDEDLPSEHTQATCVDAALRGRIAVHVVILPGDEAGAARLRDLALRTGGHAEDFLAAANLRRFLRAVDGVKVLKIPLEGGLPAELKVEVALSGGLTGTAAVARPEALSGPNPVLVALLAVAALGVVAAGYLMFWSHRRTAGRLQVRVDGGFEEHPLPRSGLTLGTKPDNRLVLVDRRVSGHHAVIRVRGKEVILTDLRSTNGTKVNDRTIRTAHLQEGDRVLLGDAVEMVYLRDAGRTGR